MTNRQAYPTDLSEQEWEIIAPLLPGQKARGRKLVYSRREILNAIFYLVRAGCAWRLVPHAFPPYRIGFHYYRAWQKDCTGTAINDVLRGQVRQAEGRNLSPSAAIIDSQSVKTTEQAGPRGFNGHKLIKGRKRHILLDTLGLLLVVVVHTAAIADSVGARSVLEKARWRFSTLKHLWAAGGYVGPLVEWAKAHLKQEQRKKELALAPKGYALVS